MQKASTSPFWAREIRSFSGGAIHVSLVIDTCSQGTVGRELGVSVRPKSLIRPFGPPSPGGRRTLRRTFPLPPGEGGPQGRVRDLVGLDPPNSLRKTPFGQTRMPRQGSPESTRQTQPSVRPVRCVRE